MSSFHLSEVDPIETLIVKHARQAFVSSSEIDRQWQHLSYLERPSFERAIVEYEHLLNRLRDFNIEIHFLTADSRVGLDSIYVRDAVVMCEKGAILCNMGKAARRFEPQAMAATLRQMQVPIVGEVTGKGQLEGGDVIWLGPRSLAVGRGYRTNDQGIRQLRQILGSSIDELLIVPLPHWRGPKEVFHLMSILSPIDRDLALVYSPLLPVPFRETLIARGVELVEVAETELDTLGINVLALGPRRCLMLAGNPETRSRLERAGVQVLEYEGQEISLKGTGGPTCLTRPIVRRRPC